jgi:glc operon protein GlcG
MKYASIPAIAILLGLLLGIPALAQQGPPAYGPSISLAAAKRVMAAAEKEAISNNWQMTIAILDSGGHIVLMQRLDNSQLGSEDVALSKARSSVNFRRPTKVFSDSLAQGGANIRLLTIEGLTPLPGGVPLIHDGLLIGAIGVSGGSGEQDDQVANAGANALNPSP